MRKENSLKVDLSNLEAQKFIEEVKNLPEKEKIEKIINSKYIGSKFEPIVCSCFGKIEKFEVLLDINENILKELGFPYKNIFLNKSEEHNLSKEITYKHIENIKVFEQQSKKDGSKISNNIQYSVNIGSYEMVDKNFTTILTNLDQDISNKLQFEMLETIPIDFFSDDVTVFNKFKNYNKSDMEQRNEFFKLVKSSSIKINVDDLGSGFSNVQKIKRLLEIFNDGQNNKLHTIKLDKDIVLYNMLHTKLSSTKDNEKRKNMVNDTFKYVKGDISNSLKDMYRIIKNEQSKDKLKEKVSNMEKDGSIYSIYTALMNFSNNNQDDFIKNLKSFNETTDFKEKDNFCKRIMRERMFIVVSETKEISKCLENEAKNLQLVREYGENEEVISYMFEKFGQINQIQGYRLFDKDQLIQINNNQEIQNKESISENFEIHQKNAKITLNKSFEILEKRLEENKAFYKKIGITNKLEVNLLVKILKTFKITEIQNLSSEQIPNIIKKYLEKHNETKRLFFSRLTNLNKTSEISYTI